MFSFVLNLPYTLIGIVVAGILQPTKIMWGNDPYRIIFTVKKTYGIGYMKLWRGMALGHTIILNSRAVPGVLEHETVHVRQFVRLPFIFPFCYILEMLKSGYRENKYEVEAYSQTKSLFETKP